jgi:hypothetical protein
MSGETVKVHLGDDYYTGPYFSETDSCLDYEVPSSQLQAWKTALAEWQSAQEEIEQVMREQAERAREARLARETPQQKKLREFVTGIYEGAFQFLLDAQPLLPKDAPATFRNAPKEDG